MTDIVASQLSYSTFEKGRSSLLSDFSIKLWASSGSENTSLDDLITYQTLISPGVETMRGTDSPCHGKPGEWTWRGNGWLKFVTSHWQILGFGEQESMASGLWSLHKSQFFSPAVINVCTRKKGRVRQGEVEGA